MAQRALKKRNRKLKKRKRKKKEKRARRFKIAPGILLLICLFASMFFILFLHSYSLALNEEVKDLQKDLKAVEAEIDAKNGQIMSSADLKSIDAQARAFGMTEARADQYIYETAARKQTALADSPAGLNDYISFFTQVRKDNLWPVTQQ